MPFIGIFTDDGLDQVVETEAQLRTERAYLQGAGVYLGSARFSDEAPLHEIHDLIRAGVSFTAAKRLAQSEWIKRRLAKLEAAK